MLRKKLQKAGGLLGWWVLVGGGWGWPQGPERWRPCGCEGSREGLQGQAGWVRRGSRSPSVDGQQTSKPGASGGVRPAGPRGHSEAPSHQQLFPASGRESLRKPISVRREGRGRQEARGLVERLRASGHAGSAGA